MFLFSKAALLHLSCVGGFRDDVSIVTLVRNLNISSVKPRLSRAGTTRRVGASCSVVFDRGRCAGCNGRCGVSVGSGEISLDVEVPNGTRVEVVASTRELARRALGCFGWPLGVVVAAAFAAEWVGGSEGLVVAAFLGAVFAVVGVRAAKAMSDRFATPTPGSAGTPDEGLRVVLRG